MLNGGGRHELSCSTCGAPLHALKMLRTDRQGPRDTVAPPALRGAGRNGKALARRKSRRRTGLMARVLDEAFDAIEDLFD